MPRAAPGKNIPYTYGMPNQFRSDTNPPRSSKSGRLTVLRDNPRTGAESMATGREVVAFGGLPYSAPHAIACPSRITILGKIVSTPGLPARENGTSGIPWEPALLTDRPGRRKGRRNYPQETAHGVLPGQSPGWVPG